MTGDERFDIDAVYRHETVRYRNASSDMLATLQRRLTEAPDFLTRLDVRPAAEPNDAPRVNSDAAPGVDTFGMNAAALLQQTFADLDRHMDDPDASNLSGQGMLELTRDRLATLAAMMFAPKPVTALPQCRDCSGVIVWSTSRNGWTHRDFTPVAHAVTPGDDARPPAGPTDNVIGWTDAEPEHEHHFPPGTPDADGYADPADCACGMTFDAWQMDQRERL